MPFRPPSTKNLIFCASAFEDTVQTSKKNKKSKIVHERLEDITLPAAEMYDINHLIETKNMDKMQPVNSIIQSPKLNVTYKVNPPTENNEGEEENVN